MEFPASIISSARPPGCCPICGNLEFSGPSFEPGLGCACHPDSLAWVCTKCDFVAHTKPVTEATANGGLP